MWKVLGPLILLVIVLLFQLQLRETFVTTGSSTDASGNIVDASGNIVTSGASTISLTLADLLNLFKTSSTATAGEAATTGTKTMLYYSQTTSAPTPTPAASTATATVTSPSSVTGGSSVEGTSSSSIAGSPYTPSAPIPNGELCSDSAAQGVEFQNALQGYIKKDEIPCYGCTL